MRRAPRFFLIALLPLVVACAETARIPRPADFPFHSSDHPFFDLHWRLDRTESAVRAIGLVEAARVDGVYVALVELREVDASGRVVNRALGQTYGGPLNRGDSRPFDVQLRPRQPGDRFEVSVWGFDWGITRGAGR
jgi:hypothetical protein